MRPEAGVTTRSPSLARQIYRRALPDDRKGRPQDRSLRKETGDGAIVLTRDGAIYKLEGVLGVGGLSVVYLATRYNDRTTVALKLPNQAAKVDGNAKELSTSFEE